MGESIKLNTWTLVDGQMVLYIFISGNLGSQALRNYHIWVGSCLEIHFDHLTIGMRPPCLWDKEHHYA